MLKRRSTLRLPTAKANLQIVACWMELHMKRPTQSQIDVEVGSSRALSAASGVGRASD